MTFAHDKPGKPVICPWQSRVPRRYSIWEDPAIVMKHFQWSLLSSKTFHIVQQYGLGCGHCLPSTLPWPLGRWSEIPVMVSQSSLNGIISTCPLWNKSLTSVCLNRFVATADFLPFKHSHYFLNYTFTSVLWSGLVKSTQAIVTVRHPLITEVVRKKGNYLFTIFLFKKRYSDTCDTHGLL